MRSRVRFPVLPWEFSLTGDDPHGGLGQVVCRRKASRPFLTHQVHISPVTLLGQRNCAPWTPQSQKLHYGHNQEGGGPQSPYGHVVALEKKYNYRAEQNVISVVP
jgi:hypothetical protein